MLVLCIIGDERVFHSKSPQMFTAVMRRMGIPSHYTPFSVHHNRIGQAVESLRTLNINGANITAPFKEKVIPHLDSLSEGANIIGAVNTVVRDGNALKGYNTNAIGFMDTLKNHDFKPAGKSALVFGTGGAARAATFIFNWLRADSVLVAGRNEEKRNMLVKQLGGEAISYEALFDHPISTPIVVNATTVSSASETSELSQLVSALELQDCELVLDLNYGQPDNIWKAMAQRNRVPFIDGLSTLANQAARTFALWTRVEVEPTAFLETM